ncbi:PLP-dependent aminotransferase family protein [Agarivorans sp. QJM3NY_25]|uniref:aminotransferase-like domain-containing protein n=1 Tax=Agarivorans sp. QJM3NY_25 TaxID=3421430 RepID=UPI003D7CFCE7
MQHLLIGFNPQARPLYLEIARCIENAILKKQLTFQDKLPAHRQLAAYIGSSAVTVRQAYQALEAKGLLSAGVGRGTFVIFNGNMSDGIKGRTDGEVNLSLVAPLVSPLLGPLQRHLKQFSDADLERYCGYEDGAGNPQHLATFSQWLQRQGVVCESEQVIPCHGAQHGLLLAILACTQVGDRVAVESLCYPGILAVLRQTGRVPVAVSLDEQGLCPQSLREQHSQQSIRALVLVASCQNPTGSVMPNNRREVLAELVKECDIQVIDDDIYGFLSEDEIKPFYSFAPSQTIYLSSLSKSVSPSLRLGLLVVPKAQRDDYIHLLRTTLWLPSPILQELACRMIRSGDVDRISQWQKQQAGQRQQLAKQIFAQFDFVDQQLPKHHAFHIWLLLPQGWSSQVFTELMAKQHIRVSADYHFAVVTNQQPAVRISLMGCRSMTQLKQSLLQIRDGLLRRC